MSISDRLDNYIHMLTELSILMKASLSTTDVSKLAWEAEMISKIIEELLSDLLEDC